MNKSKMVISRGLAIIASCAILAGCGTQNIPPSPSKDFKGGSKPIIVDSYATPNILSNMILPIYIEAKDPDGNMAGILFTVTQVGVNPDSTHYVPLSPADRKAFKGFVTIDIPKLETNERLRGEIAVVDQNGLKSDAAVKEAIIGFAYPEPLPAKWKSPEVHKLGHIFFEFLKDQTWDRTN